MQGFILSNILHRVQHTYLSEKILKTNDNKTQVDSAVLQNNIINLFLNLIDL